MFVPPSYTIYIKKKPFIEFLLKIEFHFFNGVKLTEKPLTPQISCTVIMEAA